MLDEASSIANPVNSSLIQEFYQFIVDIHKSDSYKKNNLKVLIIFSQELAPNITLYDIQKKEQILEFLNKRIKPKSNDPDEKWKTTWNDYLGRLKFFFRWLYNYQVKKDKEGNLIVEGMHEWETSDFVRIRKKKTKCDSRYLIFGGRDMGTRRIAYTYQIWAIYKRLSCSGLNVGFQCKKP